MPASWSAVRTWTRSVASLTTSNTSPMSLTSSAFASSIAPSTSSSVVAVLVVGEALDEHGDTVRAVPLVRDVEVLGAAGLGTAAALDCAVDVVVKDRGLLGLLN